MSLLDSLRFFARHPLTRDDQLRGYARFIKWQISSRLAPGAIVYEWVNGSKFLVRRGETGLTGNIYAGLHEFSEMAYLLHVLEPGDLFVDVGANVGSYTILACAAVGCRGIAVEPIPGTYARLVENMRINHLEKRVDCINAALGKERGCIAFTVDEDTANHAVGPAERPARSIEVEVRTLDEILAGRCPALMKIDVEGFEAPVIDGAFQTLGNPALHSVIMELNGSGARYGHDESRIIETMRGMGFETHAYQPYTRTLAAASGKSLRGDNTLFVRDPALVRERVARSPRLAILGKEF